MVSAALRYARILNGLSSLISRRLAISFRTRAIALLSTADQKVGGWRLEVGGWRLEVSERVDHQAARVDGEVEDACAGVVQGLAHRGDVGGVAETEQAPAAAGAAHLAAERSGAPSRREHRIDRR